MLIHTMIKISVELPIGKAEVLRCLFTTSYAFDVLDVRDWACHRV